MAADASLPDGSWTIANERDLSRAVATYWPRYGNSGAYPEALQHIKRRASELGLIGYLPQALQPSRSEVLAELHSIEEATR